MIGYNNEAPVAVNNVGQFGATEGSIGAYKQAAEYAADAKYWALLSQTKYNSIEDILAEVERLYAQGRLLEDDINQLKSDFGTQQQILLGLIQSTDTAIDNINAATELSKEATQAVLAQLDIISNMTVQTTLLPPGSMATGSYDNATGVFSFGIPEGQPGRDGTDGTISDIGSVAVGVPVSDDYGFYVDKENGGLYRSSMSDIANLVPSIRSISINGGEEQTGAVSFTSVSSFNTRTGDVIPASGDYSVDQITGAATSGANSDITSLTGLTTALSVAQGGTGGKTSSEAKTNLQIDRLVQQTVTNQETQLLSGDGNKQIFINNTGNWGVYDKAANRMIGLPVGQGGTGAITAADARTNLGLGSVSTESVVPIVKGGTGSTSAENARLALVAAKSGDNSDITSMTNRVTFTQPVAVADAEDSTDAVNLGQISSDQGASLIGTVVGSPSTVIGAVPRTIQSKLDDTVDIKDFGAIPGNAEACTSAIKAAIAYIKTQYRGAGTIHISNSKESNTPYLFNETILLDSQGLRIVGDSRWGSNIQSTTGVDPAIRITGSSCEVSNIYLTTASGVTGVHLQNGNNFTSDNLVVKIAAIGLLHEKNNSSWIRNFLAESCGTGYRMYPTNESDCNGSYIHGRSYNCEIGFEMTGGSDGTKHPGMNTIYYSCEGNVVGFKETGGRYNYLNIYSESNRKVSTQGNTNANFSTVGRPNIWIAQNPDNDDGVIKAGAVGFFSRGSQVYQKVAGYEKNVVTQSVQTGSLNDPFVGIYVLTNGTSTTYQLTLGFLPYLRPGQQVTLISRNTANGWNIRQTGGVILYGAVVDGTLFGASVASGKADILKVTKIDDTTAITEFIRGT